MQDPVTHRDWDDAHLINAALDIHADDPAFGYRFIADELPGPRDHRRREPGRAAVLAGAHLVGVRQEARTEPEGRAHRSTTTSSSASSRAQRRTSCG